MAEKKKAKRVVVDGRPTSMHRSITRSLPLLIGKVTRLAGQLLEAQAFVLSQEHALCSAGCRGACQQCSRRIRYEERRCFC